MTDIERKMHGEERVTVTLAVDDWATIVVLLSEIQSVNPVWSDKYGVKDIQTEITDRVTRGN